MKQKRFLLMEMLKNSDKTRKVFLLLAAVVMCFCMVNEAMAQQVASGTTGECTWTLTRLISSDYTLTISGNGAMGNYTTYSFSPWYKYQSTYSGGRIKTVDIQQGVTSIGDYAFYGCPITDVTISNSVTSIGGNAFSGCTGLTSVTIPDLVTTIGNYAFSACSGLTSVEIPNSVTDIGYNAFYYCTSLTSVIIGNSVTNIGGAAFSYCSGLTSVTIPNSVTAIGGMTFQRCSGLTSVTIGNSVTDIGNYAFDDCSGLTSVTIGNSVTDIGEAAFRYCTSLTSIIIPNSVTSIGSGAFRGCTGLTSVTIGNSLTDIGDNAFDNCTGLTTVNFNAVNCNAMGSSNKPVFSGCSAFVTLNIGSEVITIPSYAFYNCNSLISVGIGNSVTSIGGNAFSGCTGLTAITIPNSVTSIGGNAFSSCSGLTTVNFNAINCTTMGEPSYSSYYPVFLNCSMFTTLNIGNEVETIPAYAFYNCSGLTSVAIPNSVTSIGTSAFSGCSGLTSVTIGNSVTDIGNQAFSGCTDLTTVNFNAINCTTMGSSSSLVFLNCSAFTTLNIGNEVETIPAYAFSNCSGLTSVAIPNSVTSIGTSAFSGCSGLTTVNFNAINCTAMGSSFSNCSAFTTLNIGSEVKTIPAYAFSDCTGLAAIAIPDLVTSIGNYAFNGCIGLTSITIPNSVESIGNLAFGSCTNLKDIYVNWTTPISVTATPFSDLTVALHIPVGTAAQYRQNSYWNQFNIPGEASELPCSEPLANGSTRQLLWVICDNTLTLSGEGVMPDYTSGNTPWYSHRNSIRSVEIDERITSIGRYAFSDCINITSITIPASISETGIYAFSGCTKLETINVAADNPNYASKTGDLYNKQTTTLICVPAGKSGSYTISDNVKTINANAFYGCTKLTSVIIPNTVTSIEKYAFNGCTKLESVTFPLKLLQSYTNGFGELFHTVSQVTRYSTPNYAVTGYKQSYNRNEACSYCYYPPEGGSSSSGYRNYYYYVPSSLKTVTITDDAEVKNNFFRNTNLKTISMPLVTIIGDNAFFGCTSLVSVENLNSVTSIGNYAFYGCTNLVSMEIPNSVTSIGNYAFFGCTNLVSMKIPNSVTSIGNYAFSDCIKLVSVEIPNSVTSIGNYAFSNCNLSSITIPDGITSIGTSAFNPLKSVITPVVASSLLSSSLEKLTITSACTALTGGCLESATNLQELSVPFIGTSPTAPTTLVTLFKSSVPTTLKKLSTVYSSAEITIASGALSGLSQLNELTLSSNVIGVGNDALSGCYGIRNIYVHSVAAPAAYEGISEGVYALCVLHVPAGRAGHYESRLGWKEFLNSGGIQEEAPLVITAYTIPRRGGEILKGAGQFNYDAINTLQAGGNWGYDFQCWMEDNIVVSTNSEYTFTVIAPRTLYAVFAPRENADENIQIQTQPQEATVSWAAVTDATSYTLVIYHDDSRTDTVAAFQLDANGEIQQSSGVRAAQQDLSCSIPDLIAETQYYYSLTSYDAEDYALTIAVGDFTTQSLGLGIESVENSEIRLYPNPVRESFRIAGLVALTPVTVTDVSGKTVLQQTVAGDESISVGHLPQGVYIVNVNGKTVKIIKSF
jgi:hypothetical protein